jgi:hypothetical protein
MGLFDRILGKEPPGRSRANAGMQPDGDEQAIARYRYLVRTAPPEAIEQAHAEAFARLTPDQRRRVLAELGDELPMHERAAAQRAGDDPGALARVATRAELTRPGSLERAFGRMSASPGAGMGMAGGGFGSVLAGSFLGSMAGAVLGTTIANHFMHQHADAPSALDASHAATDDLAGTATDGGLEGDAGSFEAGGFDGDVGGFDGGSFDV